MGGVKGDPSLVISHYWSGNDFNAGVSDAQYDAWYEAALAATTIEEQMGLIKQIDWRVIEQHFQLWGPAADVFNVHQPWVIGYNGEGGFGGMQNQVVFSRLWIDSELKKEMGY